MREADPLLEEALALGDEGRWEEMAALLADALESTPDDAYLLCWAAVAERELGNETQAYHLFKRCVAQQPADPNLLALAGSGLAASDDPDAETALRTAALTGPDLPSVRIQYGAYLSRSGLFEEALEQLTAGVALAPDDPVAHGELGVLHALQGDLERATESLETALELAPDDSWTRVLVGLCYCERDRLEEAAETLLHAARERTDDAETQVLAALAAAAAGWEAAAEEALARAGFAAEGADRLLLDEAGSAVAAGAGTARAMLLDDLAPSAFHDRLTQPL
jgi:tetratricopeptide (TPR) repeat protein